MKRTIAIVAGGDSSELVVSLRSAQGLYSFIDKERYNLYIVEMEGHRWEVVLPDGSKTPIDRNDFSFMENGEKKQFDFAYITIHGTPGENGILQGYFDLLGIPYSSCNVLVSAMTFNKFTCNQYLKVYDCTFGEAELTDLIIVQSSISVRRCFTFESQLHFLAIKIRFPFSRFHILVKSKQNRIVFFCRFTICRSNRHQRRGF